MRTPPPSSRSRWTVVGLVAAGLTASGCGEERAPAPAPPAEPAPIPPPAAVEPPPTRAAKARFWLDRVVRGPEATRASTGWIPDFHEGVLGDAIRNLAALPDEAIPLLRDEALRSRLLAQGDTNPWHAILDVLTTVGARAPDVARAWAGPAAVHRERAMRRRSLAVHARLADPVDAPVFLAFLRSDPGDAPIAGGALRALLSFGAPHAQAALRRVYEEGSPELWMAVPASVDELAGDLAPTLLAWWVALAEGSGPRAHTVVRADGSNRAAVDPAAGPVVAMEHLLGDGSASAALARDRIARRAGAASGVPPEVRAERRARVQSLLGKAREPGGVEPRETFETVAAIADDATDEATQLLERVLRELRPAMTYRVALESAFDALRARGIDVGPLLAEFLAAPGEEPLLAVLLLRRARDPAHLPIVRDALPRASGRMRSELRSVAIWLTTAALERGGVELERLGAFAREVRQWVAEGETGFAATLLDLGPPGTAVLEEGLRGPQRGAYVRALAAGDARYVSPSVVGALLGPVDGKTSAEDRRAALVAAFRVAPAASEPHFVELQNRLPAGPRDEVDAVRRLVRHRHE